MSKHTSETAICGCTNRKTSIGGQALMEGIMMRGPKKTAIAVRNPKGEIVIETDENASKKRPAICRWPIIRGVFGFADSMVLGYRSLMRSAEISGLEDLEAEMANEKAAKKAAKKKAKSKGTAPVAAPVAEAVSAEANSEEAGNNQEETAAESSEKPADTSATPTKATSGKKDKKTSPLMTVMMVFSVIFALALAIGLFFFLPTFLYNLAADHISWVDGDNRYMRSAFEGIFKVTLLVGYMALMACTKDIRRTFRYHGAEHKTIFCYEHGLELTVENVRIQRRFHPRCGTSFLILMLLVGILIGFFIPPSLPVWARVIIKLLLLPLTIGLGYELIKICGRYDNWLTHIIALPGLGLQHLTVFEPDDSMIECAIAAMKEVIPDDGSDIW